MPTIAVLALQGAFIEHENRLASLGAAVFEIRQLRDASRHFDALVLPGGESTVQGKLLHDTGLFEPLRDKIADGMPVFGTCAGMILLAKEIENDKLVHFGKTCICLPILVFFFTKYVRIILKQLRNVFYFFCYSFVFFIRYHIANFV